MNKFLVKGMAAILCMTTLFVSVSCSDDDDDTKVSVSGVTLDRPSVSLAPGSTVTLNATVTPSNAANQAVTWSSSDEAVATVSSSGVVTGVAEGTATVTVKTDEGNYTANCTVTVEEGAETGDVVELQGSITSDMTLRAIDTNTLTGYVYVEDGVTLTIEPGTVIFGNSSAEGSSLIVKQGGKVIADGTKEQPIVFTSNKPKGQRDYGDWGGVILCGRAPANNSASNPTIEGGPDAHYGGDIEDDNSDILRYVRIEFAGYPFQPDKEINGLTCGAVGRGTVIEYVQVSYCGDDSFEWFGGNVNARYLIAYNGWDDDFDTDNGYSGKLQFLLGVRDPKYADTSKSNGFESDNDGEGSNNTPFTTPIFSNVTLIGPFYGENYGKDQDDILYTTPDNENGAKGGTFQAAMHIRRNSALKVYNSIFTGWPYGLYLQTTNEDATIKNCIMAGMWQDFMDDASEAYYTTAGLNNQILASTNEVIARDADYSSVVTSAITGASFADSELQDSFFEKVNCIGAFDGVNDWTAGWANFDPQNTDY
ncbi:MAG: Ig-like domain-containing protein [Tannerellaceae bacterium]|nr:Ig-like domain-containing protein [Tannerellaceae bacterium]